MVNHILVNDRKIAEKWGFGMAPIKKETQANRVCACTILLDSFNSKILLEPREELLESASTIKGLFNRVHRKDQWDWFTVFQQLGYPSLKLARNIASQIAEFRTSLKTKDEDNFRLHQQNLFRLGAHRNLSVFLGQQNVFFEAGSGWIYIMETREIRGMLKIGMTTRTLDQRAREINSATGVAIPFGVRSCWRVSHPKVAEGLIHEALKEDRVRNDREFFSIEFQAAVRKIDNTVRKNKLSAMKYYSR